MNLPRLGNIPLPVRLAAGATGALAIFAVAALAFPGAGLAQELNFNLGEGGSLTGSLLRMIALLTILSLAPGILVVVTSFTRIVVVFSLLRSAIGLQQTPPNTVIISLSLFLTAFIMMPTLQQSYDEGIAPLIAEEISEEEAFDRTIGPLRIFMLRQVREDDLAMFLDLSNEGPIASLEETPLRVLVPAFMISELRRAFEIGFLIFIPFLVIDMVVAGILLSMGMMMLPPVMISLPFKLMFFVLVDGWMLLSSSLVESFQQV
jgi:flagellar biosynthetic protein FliP